MSTVHGLEVYTYENGDDIPVPENSERFHMVEAIAHLALAVHETPEGRDRLARVATELIRLRDNPAPKKQPVPHLYNYPLKEMPHWIDLFLRRMRADFPGVRIGQVDGEAAAQKKSWGNDMNQWTPKDGGFLVFQVRIINNMAHARRQPRDVAQLNYSRFKFQMVISVAHEIVHLLVGYLTGTARPLTPPRLTLVAYGNDAVGESGRYWESILFGGVVEFYQDSNDTLQERQAGVPWLVQDGRNNVPARLVSMDYINNFLTGNFTFPIRTSNSIPETDRNGLRGSSVEMTDVRNRAARRRNNPVYTPPQAGTSSENSSMAYRRPSHVNQSYAGYYPPQDPYGNSQPGYYPPQDPYGNSQAGPSYGNSSASRYDYNDYNGGYSYRR
ncbi:hypothetical protein F4781DRAFT_410821 [Annulohypoxylon bovei var. microspora]|nr:hypothetical protein F4781DRAFT_410821 [Annulohypoxylon bovei var. microspora]